MMTDKDWKILARFGITPEGLHFGGSLYLNGTKIPIIHIDDRGYELRAVKLATGWFYTAGCRTFKSAEDALAHWGGSYYPDKDRGEGFCDAIHKHTAWMAVQAAEIERLAKDKRWIINERDRTFALMLSRAEKAEAEIERLRGVMAKAVESLINIDALDPESLVSGCSRDALSGLVNLMGAKARATLAEIKGESDE